MSRTVESTKSYQSMKEHWVNTMATFLPQYSLSTQKFFNDQEFGFDHSYHVYSTASSLQAQIAAQEHIPINMDIIEQLSIFHDIGKFFQELHSLENISIAEAVYKEYASASNISEKVSEAVFDGIQGSDFYNYRLDPSSHPPHSLEADIVRAADKMQDNLTAKVDRYYDYGVNKRGAVFFIPTLTLEERSQFSFDNFSGDQLNVILSIIGLRPEDFSRPILQNAYRQWSIPAKEAVVKRILELAQEVGESEDHQHAIKNIIGWYRSTFTC